MKGSVDHATTFTINQSELFASQVELLKSNPHVVEFTASNIAFIDPQAVSILCDALLYEKKVREVNFVSCSMEAEDVKVIAQSLLASENTHLKSACFWLARFGVQGGVYLGHALSTNQSLVFLDLNNCRLKSIDAIAEALKVNHSLTHLDLGYNKISAKSVLPLAQALVLNRSLRVLLLGSNHIEDEGAQAIAMVLNNSALKSLDISRNGVCSFGLQSLLDALRHPNSMLTSVSLADDAIQISHIQMIEDTLTVNGTIQNCPNISDNVDNLCQRNKTRHQIIQSQVMTILAIRRYRKSSLDNLLKEMVIMIAMTLWKTRSSPK